ncbi:hypothetical protein DRQ26_05100 [bacterium]|nr:MAG: hypothetical protein DRQ26_05100 [bacterium]
MKLIPEKNKNVVEISQESKYKKYSRRAIENMHDFAQWRVMQLEHHDDVLHYLGSLGGELEELFEIAARIERVEKNHTRFKKLEEELLYELMRRGDDDE